VKSAMSNYDLASRYANRAKEIAAMEYTPETFVSRIERAYRELLGGTSHS